jgi:hypothetical protein
MDPATREAYLPVQVDLERGVDAGHLRVGGDQRGAVGLLGAQHADSRVVVDVLVQLGGPEAERGRHRAPRVERTRPLEGEQPVGEHLRPDAQSPAPDQPADGRVGDGADPHLQGRTVRDACSEPVRHHPARLVGRLVRRRGKWAFHLHGDVDPRLVDECVAEGVRHRRVHHGDHETTPRPARLQGGREHVDLRAEAEVPVLRWRAVHHDDIRGSGGGEQLWHEREAAGKVLQGVVAAHARADERGLRDDTVAVRQAAGGVQHPDPVCRQGAVQCGDRRPRGRAVAAHHHPRRAREGGQESLELLERDVPHATRALRCGMADGHRHACWLEIMG